MQLLILVSLAMAMIGSELPNAPLARWGPTGPIAALLLTIGSMAVVAGLCAAFNLRVARGIDRTEELDRRRYRRRLMLLGWLMLLVFAGQVFWAGWPSVPLGVLRPRRIPLIAELLVWTPFLLMLLAYWASAYQVDVRLRLLDVRRRLASGLPVYASGGPARPIWSLGQFLAFQFRFHLLLVLLPLVAIILLNAGLSRLFAWAEPALDAGGLSAPQRGLILAGLILGAVLAVLTLSPPVLARVFSSRPMPAGTLLIKLRKVLDQAHARVRRILLWNTYGMISNAAVMGLWGRLRYVLLSDGLLESLPDEQIEGVFGHELGHVVHHHIFYYLLLIFSLLTWAGYAFDRLAELPAIKALAERNEAYVIPLTATALAAMTVVAAGVFGWVSRRFERQADLTGAQMIVLGPLADSPFLPIGTIVSAAGELPCPADQADLKAPPHPGSAEVYAVALLRIADINGLDPGQRTWRHGSIAGRCDHVRRLCHPRRFSNFQALIRTVKWAILALAAGAAMMTLAAW